MRVNHNQLIFAREYRGFSQTDLSLHVDGLSQPNLSKFEKGLSTMSMDLLKKVMDYLEFPFDFLSRNISNESETAHFRKRSTITKRDRVRVEQSYRLIGYLVDEMSDSISWPEFALEALNIESGYTPESVAKHTRKVMGIKPTEPVTDIYRFLEMNGIIVVELDEIEKFDGVSFVSDNGYPVIVLNSKMSNDRKRFTLAHELGHLLMHSIDNPAIPEYRKSDLEDEANRFASEFLMPESSIRNSLYGLKLAYLFELKRYWKTSMASLVYRAKDLGCITPDKYHYLNVELSRRGLRKNEGTDVSIDTPQLFLKGYDLHRNELSYTDPELATGFSLPIDVIEAYFKPIRRNGKLRVVV